MTDWLNRQDLDAPLDLTNLGLQSLPAHLPTGLQRLDVSHNQLQSLPDNLPDGLQSLYASHNQLQSLPERLPATLQVLEATHNQLQSLPENLPDGLQGLEVSHNQLQSLPEHLPAALQHLYVNNNQLQSLPEHLPAALQHLYANNNQLRSLPAHLPAELRGLHVSQNQLQSLPDRLPAELITLDASHNQLSRLPEHLPDRLEVLDASHNRLSILPERLPEGMKELIVSHNQLPRLPEHLPEGMETLEASHNQLERLPELPAALEVLDVSHNQLPRLPQRLPAPLVVLVVSHNQLSRLPERLPDDLEVLDVSYNQLQILPARLPADLDLRGRETNPLLAGPQLQAGPQLHPLAWAVAAWPRPEGAPANQAEIAGRWQAFANEPGAAEFTGFLRELAGTVNARRSPDFRSRVGEWLCLLETRPELRRDTFDASLSATDTCQDRVSLTFNAMHQLRLASDVELGQYDQRLPELIQLARGMFRLDELNTIARETAEWQESQLISQGISQDISVDPVEIELYYQVKLRESLELPVAAEEMVYGASARLTDDDEEHARTRVLVAETQSFLAYLSTDWGPWQTVLKRLAKEPYEAAIDQRLEALTGDEFNNRLQARLRQDRLETDADAQRVEGPKVMAEISLEIMGRLTTEFLARHGLQAHMP